MWHPWVRRKAVPQQNSRVVVEAAARYELPEKPHLHPLDVVVWQYPPHATLIRITHPTKAVSSLRGR
jgi:hypothetical protein